MQVSCQRGAWWVVALGKMVAISICGRLLHARDPAQGTVLRVLELGGPQEMDSSLAFKWSLGGLLGQRRWEGGRCRALSSRSSPAQAVLASS